MLTTPRWAWAGVACLLGLALLPLLGLMAFAHPYFDDYVNANATAVLGRWANQGHIYQHWSGRYTAVFLSTMLNPLAWWPLATHLAGLRLWLAAGLLAHLLALGLFFRALLVVLAGGRALPRPSSLAGGLALLVLSLGLNALPEPFSFLYWYAASFVYQLGWVFTLGFGAAALWAVPLPAGAVRRGWATGAALCLALALGSSELALLCCLVGLAGLGWWVHRYQPAARGLWLGWAAVALVGAVAALAAPGNYHRAALTDVYPQAHRWLLLLPRTGLAAWKLATQPLLLAGTLGAVVVGLGLAQVVRPQPAALPPRADVLAALAGYAALNTVGVAFLKTFWVEPLLGRVSNLLGLVLLVSSTVLALWVGTWWRPLPALPQWGRGAVGLLAGGLLGLFAVGQVGRAWQELLLVAPTYDQQMQARYAQLRRARVQGPRLVTLPLLHLPLVPGVLVPLDVPGRHLEYSVEVKPGYAENVEIARYFGLEGVRGQPAQ